MLHPTPKKPTVDVWGIPFSQVTTRETVDWIGELIERRVPEYLITANLNYVMLAAEDPSLESVTKNAVGIVADGMPIVVRSRRDNLARLPERVAGSELIYRLAEQSANRGWKIYFLGAAPGVAKRCADRLSQLYPGIQIAGIESPPFRELNDVEQADQEARIRDAGTDILLVAFGQPKGERWIAEHYQRIGIPVSIQLGASFDFVAGTARRAPKAWQKCGMEWAYRMLSDPRRLVPRYFDNAVFLAKVIVGEITGGAFGLSTSRRVR